MSDALNPTGPSQPTQSQAYTTAGNPATGNPVEASIAKQQQQQQQRDRADPQTSNIVDQRIPQEQSAGIEDATPSSLGRGVRAPGRAGEEARGAREEDVGRHTELDAEQMAAPGEGRVREAVVGKTGASGGEPGLETDLERKKAEQAPLREAIKEQRAQNVDVGGVLGQTGGPANPVGKNNYPNTSD